MAVEFSVCPGILLIDENKLAFGHVFCTLLEEQEHVGRGGSGISICGDTRNTDCPE